MALSTNFTKLSPQDFAQLDPQGQRDYQVGEADDFLQQVMNGGQVSQSERDFTERILEKQIPSSPTPTGFENSAVGVADLISSVGTGLGKFELKTLLIPLVILVAVIVLVFMVKK